MDLSAQRSSEMILMLRECVMMATVWAARSVEGKDNRVSFPLHCLLSRNLIGVGEEEMLSIFSREDTSVSW